MDSPSKTLYEVIEPIMRKNGYEIDRYIIHIVRKTFLNFQCFQLNYVRISHHYRMQKLDLFSSLLFSSSSNVVPVCVLRERLNSNQESVNRIFTLTDSQI